MDSKHLNIRDYNSTDYLAVEKVWNDTGMGGSFRGDTDEVISKTLTAGGKLYILENKSTNEIIGTSWLTSDGRRIYLHHFGIKPEYQGMGYSKILLEKSLDFAKSTRLQIKLEVHRKNITAISLYKKEGFNYLGDYDIYIMREFPDKD